MLSDRVVPGAARRARSTELMAGGRGPARRAVRHAASPSRPRCSSRSRCCAATGAATARSPSRRPGSTRRTSRPTRCSRSRARGAELGCCEALFTLGEAPEARYPQAAEWLAAHGYASTVDYLVAVARAACSTRPACSPTPTRARSSQAELERLRAVSPSQGMMIETLAARLGEPGGPHYGAPDKTPERRLATLDAAGRARVPFTTGILVGIGETRAERIDALDAIAERAPRARSRARSDRPELPAEAGHRDAPRRAVPARRVPLVDRGRRGSILPADVHLQAPPNLSDDLAPLLAAGIDDWGGVSPRHRRPREPRAAVARARAAAGRDRSRGPRARAAAHRSIPSSCATRRRGSTPTLRTPVLVASDSEGLARDGAWSPGRDDLAPPDAAPGAGPGARAVPRSARCSPACSPAKRSASTRSSRCSSARGPGGRAGRRGRRRAAPRDRRRRGHVRPQPQHQLHERLHVQVPVLRVLEGSALAQPARPAVPARDGGDAAARRRGRRVRRDRGVPAGRHPSRLRRRLLRRRRAGGEGGRARRSTCTASPRSRSPKARAGSTCRSPTTCCKLKDAGLATLPGHRGRDPRRRSARGHLPRQGEHRGVARSAPHRALGRAAVERHDHVRHRRAAGARRAPPRAHARPAEGDRRLHRVRAAAVRAHGDADLPAGQGAARPDVPRGAADARGRPHRVPRLRSTTCRRRG